MGHTALPSTIGGTGPKWDVDERPTEFLQANPSQPPGLLPFRSRVAPHGQQGAQYYDVDRQNNGEQNLENGLRYPGHHFTHDARQFYRSNLTESHKS
ncbi:hypothetical protein ElyMa_001987100 [Elysia marginata]|uniref:Uncharacterized protein n=1 Tax=Elysia marginata TaxID=1093978 RepID=A0AAV4F257_9GAST|nr:hypothetical protein ElyMa_001987100 [Elysia marginata]